MIMLVYTREECTCVDSCELVYNNVSVQQMVLFPINEGLQNGKIRCPKGPFNHVQVKTFCFSPSLKGSKLLVLPVSPCPLRRGKT